MPTANHDTAHLMTSIGFMQQWGHRQEFELLFHELNDVFFFAKDIQGHLVGMNAPLLQRFAQILDRPSSEIIGLTDYDLHPKELADQYRQDDHKVMLTGQPLIGHVELWYNNIFEFDWSITTKVPVYGIHHDIIGVMGTVRSYQQRRDSIGELSSLDNVVEFIQKNHRHNISVTDIARQADLSVRQLHRQFQRVFSMSAQEFLIRTRLQTAKTALIKSDTQISHIASDCGFYDQSAFTKMFRKHLHMTPRQFRQKYRTEL